MITNCGYYEVQSVTHSERSDDGDGFLAIQPAGSTGDGHNHADVSFIMSPESAVKLANALKKHANRVLQDSARAGSLPSGE